MTLQQIWTVNVMTRGKITLDPLPGDALVSEQICIADTFEDAVEWLVTVRLEGRGKYHGGAVLVKGEIYAIAASNAVTGVVSTYSIIRDYVYKADKWKAISEHDTVQDAIEAILKRVDWPTKEPIHVIVDDGVGDCLNTPPAKY